MKAHSSEICIIGDEETIAAIWDDLRSEGRIVICYACGDIEALIACFVIFEEKEEAWALCDACVRKVCIFGAVA